MSFSHSSLLFASGLVLITANAACVIESTKSDPPTTTVTTTSTATNTGTTTATSSGGAGGAGGATTSSGGAGGAGGATTSSGGAGGSGGATTSSGGAGGAGGATATSGTGGAGGATTTSGPVREAPPAWAGENVCSHEWPATANVLWAKTLIGKSSEYSATDWSASQALGKPDVLDQDGYLLYGASPKAWSSATIADGEWIEVGFAAQTLVPYSVEIYATSGNNGVKNVKVTYEDDTTEDEDFQPTDGDACAFSHEYYFNNADSKKVKSVRVTVDQKDIVGYYTAIDAIGLRVQ